MKKPMQHSKKNHAGLRNALPVATLKTVAGSGLVICGDKYILT